MRHSICVCPTSRRSPRSPVRACAARAELKGTLKQSSATTRLDLDANTELAGGATLIAGMLAGGSRLQLVATLTDRNVEVERLVLNGRALSVSASGVAERGTTSTAPAVQSLRARYEANLTNLTVLSPTLAGTVKLKGDVDGPIKSLTTRLQLTSSLSVRGSPRETIEASIKARGLPSRVSATLQAQGRFGGAPLQLDASLERGADDTFHVVVHRSEWKSASLEGDLTTAANAAPGHGSLRLRMDRVADLQPLLGTQARGQHRRRFGAAAGRRPHRRTAAARCPEYRRGPSCGQCAADGLRSHRCPVAATRRAISRSGR